MPGAGIEFVSDSAPIGGDREDGMSDTPRTDAAAVSSNFIYREMDHYSQTFVLADFARTLERELAAALQDAQTLRNLRADLNERVEEMRGQLAAVTAERDALRRDAERYRWLRADCIRATEIIGHYNAAEPKWTDAAIDAAISAPTR